jgi:hypothetical protein
MDATTQNIDKSHMSSYTKSAKDITALSGKKILAFPSTLGSTVKDSEGNDFNYVIIRINTVTTGSKLKEDKEVGDVLVASGAVQTGAAFDIGKIGNTFGTKNQADKDLISRYGTAASAENKTGWTKKVGLSKLDRVIVLPMPEAHTVRTSIGYDENVDQGELSDITDFVSSIGSSAGASAYLGKAASAIAASVLSGIIDKAKSVGGGGPGQGADAMQTKLLAMAKVATNPKKEVLFKDIGFRSFEFSYVLSPKNVLESTTIQEIIRTLRYYALPELNPNKLFYTFPAEFEIALMKGGSENPALPKIATCILKDVGVQYSGGNTWVSFPDGLPPMVTLTLSFMEIEIIDRGRVWNKDSVITSGY